ncbi:hypothetical protein ACIQ9K_35625 [Streptomyces microflavus]|uniref:hypothetical protein n=1 Tax=Streptomyces microflavus TaxID=1919 RepID=UPI0037F4EE4B
MPSSESVRLRTDSGAPYMITVPHDVVTDPRLSAADVGVYMLCRWLMDLCFPYGDLTWLITELGVPDAETRDSVQRLVELGHLETFGANEAEFHEARAVSQHVRDAIDATLDDLTPAERVAVARFADLVDLRRDRAVAAQRSKDLSDE